MNTIVSHLPLSQILSRISQGFSRNFLNVFLAELLHSREGGFVESCHGTLTRERVIRDFYTRLYRTRRRGFKKTWTNIRARNVCEMCAPSMARHAVHRTTKMKLIRGPPVPLWFLSQAAMKYEALWRHSGTHRPGGAKHSKRGNTRDFARVILSVVIGRRKKGGEESLDFSAYSCAEREKGRRDYT